MRYDIIGTTVSHLSQVFFWGGGADNYSLPSSIQLLTVSTFMLEG